MNKIPVYLITGFLGSGKSTLIKGLLNSYRLDKRIAVIQNEFAPESFDGKDIRRNTTRDFDLLEVNNGSVFCVCLLSGFIGSFIRFIDEYKPDIVLFETSGLSDPISIGELFNTKNIQEKAFLAASICVADASNFIKLQKLQQRVVHQLQIANRIILNKIDLEQNYHAIQKEVQKINPQASIITATYCQVDFQDIIGDLPSGTQNTALSFAISAEDIGRPDICSVVFKSIRPIHDKTHKEFLGRLTENMLRMKGYLYLDNDKSLAIQYSGRHLETNLIHRKEKQTELIAMGFNIGFSEVKRIYEQYC